MIVSSGAEGLVSTPEDVAAALDPGNVTEGEVVTPAAVDETGVDSPAGDVAVCWHLVQMVLVLVMRTVLIVTPTLVLVTLPEV